MYFNVSFLYSRPAVTEHVAPAVPADPCGGRMARASRVSPLLRRPGGGAGLHGRAVPRGNLRGPDHPVVLQPGEGHASHGGGDTAAGITCRKLNDVSDSRAGNPLSVS